MERLSKVAPFLFPPIPKMTEKKAKRHKMDFTDCIKRVKKGKGILKKKIAIKRGVRNLLTPLFCLSGMDIPIKLLLGYPKYALCYDD